MSAFADLPRPADPRSHVPLVAQDGRLGRAAHSLDLPRTDRTRRTAVVAHDGAQMRASLVGLWPELRTRAMQLTGNAAAAEDIAQEATERALRFAAQYEQGTNLRAWAMQILFSVFVTRWRRRRRERMALDRMAADPSAWTFPCAATPPDAGDGVLLSSTRRTLESLPDGFRAVIVLVDLERMSYRDAARSLGVPLGTVMSRLHRGRKLLSARMDAHV